MIDHDRDEQFMRRALALAERGWGRVHPNPMVGAVVVRDDRVIGEGWHAEYGGPHAEVAAIAAADDAAGTTLYVTLEPCNHHGKTPPCTDAIAAAGIARVVYAAPDPNPVAGGGAAVLEQQGIAVSGGVLADEARMLNAIFHYNHRHHRPFITLKLALSLDGRIAVTENAPIRLTGDEADAEVHRLRAGHDAIMVGIGTALADDPRLTARGAIRPRVPPARVVIDSTLRIPSGARLFQTIDAAPLIVVTAEDADPGRAGALHAAGATIVRVGRSDRGLDMAAALAALHELGIRSIMAEGGSRLAGSLLGEDRVQRLILFYAPVFLGGSAVPAIRTGGGGLQPELPGRLDSPAWRTPRCHTHGADTALIFDRSGLDGVSV